MSFKDNKGKSEDDSFIEEDDVFTEEDREYRPEEHSEHSSDEYDFKSSEEIVLFESDEQSDGDSEVKEMLPSKSSRKQEMIPVPVFPKPKGRRVEKANGQPVFFNKQEMIPVPIQKETSKKHKVEKKREEKEKEKKVEKKREEKKVEETPSERNMRIKASIKVKDAVIFCRVSTYNQSVKFCISLEAQEENGRKCAVLFGLKVMSTIKIVESASNGKKCTIKRLIRENRGKNIIIYDVSRFCRSVERGMSLLEYALNCKTRLFFVNEGIVWDSSTERFARDKLRARLEAAQEESANIGRRVSMAIQEKKRRGFFTGRVAPFGYTIKAVEGGKKLFPNENETPIVDFINACRTVGRSMNSLNRKLARISRFKNSPIVLEFKDEPVKKLQEPLSYSGIADLLNDYEVFNRGNEWTSAAVKKVAEKIYKEEVGEVIVNIEKLGFDF